MAKPETTSTQRGGGPRVRPTAVLGVALGGTNLGVLVGTPGGRIVAELKQPTPAAAGPDAVIAEIVGMADELRREHDVSVVGVAHGGPVEADGNHVSSPNMPGWERVPLADRLADALGLPVLVENDANAGALAELHYGAGRGLSNIAYLTMGTGIGGGLILGGTLFRGAQGLAGEVGHTTVVRDGAPCACGKRGCLQAYASGSGIAARAREAGVGDPDLLARAGGDIQRLTCKMVCEAARAGNPIAQRIVREAAVYMGIGIANLTLILDLELVALGTLAVVAGDLLLPTIRATVAEQTGTIQPTPCRVEPSALGARAASLAALAVVRGTA